MILTDAQQAAYDRLSNEWATVGEPSPMIGSDCAMVEVSGGYSNCSFGYYRPTMWLGIESNGYTHS